MRHRWITEEQFASALLDMVATYNRLGFPEPIPYPSPDRVARAAGTVTAANEPVFGVERFETLTQKVAYVFYELAKQHFFINGNKRIATYFLLYLLEMHGFRLEMSQESLANFTEWVAASEPARRDSILSRVERRVDGEIGPAEGWTEADDLYGRQRETRRHRTR